MFSTFTGTSRRPRNVNLSGGVGNPFSNTSWSPSAVSNTTQTVTNAQVDREKRQAERRRTKAAGSIQRVWRGHQGRQSAAQLRRDAFDALYQGGGNDPSHLPQAFSLLLLFFTPRRPDDIDRLMGYIRGCDQVQLPQSHPPGASMAQLERLAQILLQTLGHTVSKGSSNVSFEPLVLLVRLVVSQPRLLDRHIDEYYITLAKLCQVPSGQANHERTLFDAVQAPLVQDVDDRDSPPIVDTSAKNIGHDFKTRAYLSLASRLLTRQEIGILGQENQRLLQNIQFNRLEHAILIGYTTIREQNSIEELLRLLARYISLARDSSESSDTLVHLRILQIQLSALAPEIALRAAEHQSSTTFSEDSGEGPGPELHEPAVYSQLVGLVSYESMSTLLRQLSISLEDTSAQGLESASLFTSYISTLLLCFPTQADDIRMRLFLAAVPSKEGDIPLIRLLWQKVRHSTLVRKIVLEPEEPVKFLRDFILGNVSRPQHRLERQEWQVLILFLEQYVFVLRLSDDEDFFSAFQPQLVGENAPSSRIRSSSLSLDDLKILTAFLKNTAFALYYKSRDILTPRYPGSSRGSFFNNDEAQRETNNGASSMQESTLKIDLETLRGTITSVMRMLYERDSRKQFLPTGHWLMTDKLDREDFVGAVILEEEKQNLEADSDNSDDEEEGHMDFPSLGPRARHNLTFYGSRLTQHARVEILRHQQRKVQKERRLAEMGPKLEILKHMPFVVPFETRVKIFRQFIKLDIERRNKVTPHADLLLGQYARVRGNIRRGHLFEDAYSEFFKLGESLKDPMQITFLDEFEMPEAGIDGGGVTKEFLTSVTNEAFTTSTDDVRPSKFSISDQGQLYPNPIAVDCMRELLRKREAGGNNIDPNLIMAEYLKRYEFLGRIIGKCLYEGTLVDISFAGFFLLQWASAGSREDSAYKGSMNDLRDMDEELYKGMLRLKNYPGDVSELCIDFTIEDQVSPPSAPRKVVTKKLIPNGDKIFVTNDTRLLYISYVARHRLVNQPALQTAAFLRGLRLIIRPSWLSMFNQSELQRLVGGDSRPIDLDDLRRNISYSGLYEIGDDGIEHPTIVLFWKALKKFTDAQVRDLLKYVTSTPRAPLLGFSQLRPLFSIRDGGRDEERLPSASTCVNLLKLPQYTTEKTVREKLLYAISSNAGFDLS